MFTSVSGAAKDQRQCVQVFQGTKGLATSHGIELKAGWGLSPHQIQALSANPKAVKSLQQLSRFVRLVEDPEFIHTMAELVSDPYDLLAVSEAVLKGLTEILGRARALRFANWWTVLSGVDVRAELKEFGIDSFDDAQRLAYFLSTSYSPRTGTPPRSFQETQERVRKFLKATPVRPALEVIALESMSVSVFMADTLMEHDARFFGPVSTARASLHPTYLQRDPEQSEAYIRAAIHGLDQTLQKNKSAYEGLWSEVLTAYILSFSNWARERARYLEGMSEIDVFDMLIREDLKPGSQNYGFYRSLLRSVFWGEMSIRPAEVKGLFEREIHASIREVKHQNKSLLRMLKEPPKALTSGESTALLSSTTASVPQQSVDHGSLSKPGKKRKHLQSQKLAELSFGKSNDELAQLGHESSTNELELAVEVEKDDLQSFTEIADYDRARIQPEVVYSWVTVRQLPPFVNRQKIKFSQEVVSYLNSLSPLIRKKWYHAIQMGRAKAYKESGIKLYPHDDHMYVVKIMDSNVRLTVYLDEEPGIGQVWTIVGLIHK